MRINKYQKIIKIIDYQKNVIANLIYFDILNIFDYASSFDDYEENRIFNSLNIYNNKDYNYPYFIHYFEIINSFIVHYSLYYACNSNNFEQKIAKYNNLNKKLCIERIYLYYLINEKEKILSKYKIEEIFYNKILNNLFSVPCSYIIPYFMIEEYDYSKLYYVFGDIFDIKYYLNYSKIAYISNSSVLNHIFKIIDFHCTILNYECNKNNNCLWFRNGSKYDYYDNNYTNFLAYIFINCSIIYDKIYTNNVLNNKIYYIIKFTINSINDIYYSFIKNYINEKLLLCGLLNYTTLENILNSEDNMKNNKLLQLIYYSNIGLSHIDILQYVLLLNNNIELLKKYLKQIMNICIIHNSYGFFCDKISISKLLYSESFIYIKNMFIPTIELLIVNQHYIKLIEYMALIYENNLMFALINLFRLIIFSYKVHDKNTLTVLEYYTNLLLKEKPDLILFEKNDINKPILDMENNLYIFNYRYD